MPAAAAIHQNTQASRTSAAGGGPSAVWRAGYPTWDSVDERVNAARSIASSSARRSPIGFIVGICHAFDTATDALSGNPRLSRTRCRGADKQPVRHVLEEGPV